jgi:predicted small secreted protein
MKTTHRNIIMIILAAALVALTGTSCRTVNGVGQDVEHAGDHIQKAAH